MSAAEGQEPPHVPHWMHISRFEIPAVRDATSLSNVGSSVCGGVKTGVDEISGASVIGPLFIRNRRAAISPGASIV